MIELKNLRKTYIAGGEEIRAVDDVNLKAEKGDFISIVGHSGSGKTTLLSLIGGLTKPDSGTAVIDGIDIWSITDDGLSEFRNGKISFIYQFSSLFSSLNVLENVLLPTAFGKGRKAGLDEYALKLLGMVGLEDKSLAYPSELSGGQQRRAAIARAFITNPPIVLADEPTGDLDEETENGIMNLFHRMNEENDITFLVVTHSLELAKNAKRKLRMSHGKLQEI